MQCSFYRALMLWNQCYGFSLGLYVPKVWAFLIFANHGTWKIHLSETSKGRRNPESDSMLPIKIDKRILFKHNPVAFTEVLLLSCTETWELGFFRILNMVKLRIPISAADLLKDVVGCWQQYKFIVCTDGLGTDVLPQRVLFLTFPKLLTFSTHLRILVCSEKVFWVKVETFSHPVSWYVFERTGLNNEHFCKRLRQKHSNFESEVRWRGACHTWNLLNFILRGTRKWKCFLRFHLISCLKYWIRPKIKDIGTDIL